ncbi:MAG: prepilin-type N-terminal cleavage/methylation domain-containing protein [Arcobacteraceae bacterium]|nr:prepilin-type N-terminal cleavage/methylation domain-containing protein [Arcobacteraceae bacterium]
MRKKAFTLIEISIVLIIIGIILTSIMKGRDLLRSSKIKEFSQTFVNEWEIVTDSYFNRMGNNLADSINNGGTAADIDGFMDGNITTTTHYSNIDGNLTASGIDICQSIKADIKDGTNFCTSGYNPFKRGVSGEFTGTKIVTITFTNYIINGRTKNILLFNNIPGDVAQAIDTMRDGIPNGTDGNVIALESEESSGATPTLVNWDSNSTQSMGIIIH